MRPPLAPAGAPLRKPFDAGALPLSIVVMLCSLVVSEGGAIRLRVEDSLMNEESRWKGQTDSGRQAVDIGIKRTYEWRAVDGRCRDWMTA